MQKDERKSILMFFIDYGNQRNYLLCFYSKVNTSINQYHLKVYRKKQFQKYWGITHPRTVVGGEFIPLVSQNKSDI